MCNTTIEEGSRCSQEQPANAAAEEPTPPLLVQQESHADAESSYGSTVGGAIFNFTNCIVGAGAIGLGGAFADSGGLISVATIIFFAFLTKLSLDLVVTMSVEQAQPHQHYHTSTSDNIHGTSAATTNSSRSASYEELGYLAFGQPGRIAVLLSKFLYSFGCLVAYIIVVKDNFAPALQHFIFGGDGHPDENASWFNQFLSQDGAEDKVTLALGIFVILPLCLLRDMTPLSSLGAVSIASMICIVLIVIYIYVTEPDIRHDGGGFYENWLEVRPGYVESWGTFVFTFVSQHTVNLAFESLKPEIRTVNSWKKVSTWSISTATAISLTVGAVVYATFWDQTKSDLFDMYPPMRIIDLCKILLCLTMLLTFPLPFFSCRELLIVSIIRPLVDPETEPQATINVADEADTSLQQPLLSGDDSVENQNEETLEDNEANPDSTSVIFEDPHERSCKLCQKLRGCYGGITDEFSVMIPGEEKQLSTPFHIALTVFFWGLSTFLAIVSPNLGDILDLVGAASGTAMAFILPSLLSFKLQGYSILSMFILLVGGAVGIVGSYESSKKLFSDI